MWFLFPSTLNPKLSLIVLKNWCVKYFSLFYFTYFIIFVCEKRRANNSFNACLKKIHFWYIISSILSGLWSLVKLPLTSHLDTVNSFPYNQYCTASLTPMQTYLRLVNDSLMFLLCKISTILFRKVFLSKAKNVQLCF